MAKSKHSRKGKKEWRKNIDDKDAVDAQRARDLQRELAARSNDQLFIVDKRTKPPVMTRAERKEHNRTKVLKQERILAGAMSPDAANIINNNNTRKRKLHTENFLIDRIAKKMKTKLDDTIGSKSSTSSATISSSSSSSSSSSTSSTKNSAANLYDVWSAQAPVLSNRKQRIVENKEKQIRKGIMKTPQPGISYHPSYEQHQDTLGSYLAREIRRQDFNDMLNRRLHPTGDFSDEKGITADVDFLEMSLGIERSDDESEEKPSIEEIDNALDEQSDKEKQHYSIKLSQTERNKMLRKRIERAMLRKKNARKMRNKELRNLPKVVQRIEDREQLLDARRKEIDRHRQYVKEKRNPRLGKLRIVDNNTDYLLTEELPSNLRSLKPQGSLAHDCWVKFQRRNMIEPRRPTKLRPRYKKKLRERNSARDYN